MVSVQGIRNRRLSDYYTRGSRSQRFQFKPFPDHIWVDMFGDAVTRDVEPTVSDGGAIWRLLRSCLRVLAAGDGCADGSNSSAPAEACCDVQSPARRWKAVWALELSGSATTDLLLTVDRNERQELLASGDWREVCSPFGGPSAFCDGTASDVVAQYTRGPFLLYAVAQAPPAATSSPVYRCFSAGDDEKVASGQYHFVSGDASCYGRGKQETLLGFASSARLSGTPRSLRSCAAASGAEAYHSLDTPCTAGDEELGHLGFVH